MRGSYGKAFLIALVSTALLNCNGASTKSRTLSGKMAWWQRMVAGWTCDVTIEPGPGQTPQSGILHAIGVVAPNNVFHLSIFARGFNADQYDGYSQTKGTWWETQADSTGAAVLLRSADDRTFDEISWPPSSDGPREKYKEIYSIGRDGQFTQTVKRLSGAAWHVDSLESCTKTS